MSKPDDPQITKSVRLPKSLWNRLADYRFARRISTEAEAHRMILDEALPKPRRATKREATDGNEG